MKQILGLILPILAALLLAIFFASKTPSSELDAARARWDARPFTRYRMRANYIFGNGLTCQQEVIVDGDHVVSVLWELSCEEEDRLPSIQYPSVTDIFNYLQGQVAIFESQPNDCAPMRKVDVVGIYDRQLGYPLRSDITWNYSRRWSFNAMTFHMLQPPCIGDNLGQSRIVIVSLTPE